jgi:signal transduction histidine kinase
MSVRLRLTIWNVCVLALMLVGLGTALRWTLQETLLASVDRNLLRAAHREQYRAANPPPSPLPQYGPPPGAGADANGPFGPYHPRAWDRQGNSLGPGAPLAPYDLTLFHRSLLGRQSYRTEKMAGQRVRALSVPLLRGGHIVGVAQVAYPLEEVEAEVRRLTGVLLLLAGPALLIAGAGGAWLTTRALRPVRQITHAAGRIGARDLSGRLPVTGRDELSELAGTFNGMLGRLEGTFGRLEETNAQLEEANAQQRRFIADASHELKSPLTVIAGTVSLSLSGQRTAEQHQQALETIGRSAAAMTRIVQDLLLLAHSDAGELLPERRSVSVADVLALAREALSARPGLPQVTISAPPKLEVYGDPDSLVRLFVNLFDNAARHTSPDGRITITACVIGEWVEVIVEDTGVGIAPEHLPHLGERFYRVDSARARAHGGTGLGLAICRSIAEAHEGSMTIESEWGQGTSVHVRLPRVIGCQQPEE